VAGCDGRCVSGKNGVSAASLPSELSARSERKRLRERVRAHGRTGHPSEDSQ
jgi:hypothetical protein